MKAVAAVVLSGVIAMFSGNATGAEQDTKSEQTKEGEIKEVIVNYDIIQSGTYSGKKDAVAQVIQDRVEWEKLWKQHVSVLVPQPPLPDVDFESEVVVAIFAGEKKSGGYAVMIKKATIEANDVVIRYKLTEPQPNSFTLQVITQPFVLLKMDKPPGSVRLIKE